MTVLGRVIPVIMVMFVVVILMVVVSAVVMTRALGDAGVMEMRMAILCHPFKRMYMRFGGGLMEMLMFMRMEVDVDMLMTFRSVHVPVGMQE